MLYLINQWQETKVPKSWKPGYNIALIKKGEGPRGQKPWDEKLCGGNVRIDLQTWNKPSSDYPHTTANVQGQVLEDSVLQVNIDPETKWGVQAIKNELISSMNEVQERWMPEKR
jgi:hypothetical protein